MPVLETGRWPAIYSLKDLQKAIREILASGAEFESKFYVKGRTDDPLVCQGDVVELRSPLPLLDENGEPAVHDGADFEHWLVVSNTCDHERATSVQLSPLIVLQAEVGANDISTLKRYEYAKRFYVPPWPGGHDERHRVADFTQSTVLLKTALTNGSAKIVGRLDFPGWALLHTCLVMYLARDDGRFD